MTFKVQLSVRARLLPLCAPKTRVAMRAALLGMCLAGLALSARAAAGQLPEQQNSSRRSLSGQPPLTCAPVYYTMPDGEREELPACSQDPTAAGGSAAAAAAASERPLGEQQSVAAAALGAPSNAYPCKVGDAACFCQWKGGLGYFADNDVTSACT